MNNVGFSKGHFVFLMIPGSSRGSFLRSKTAPKTRCKPRPPLGAQKWLPNRFRSAPGTLRERNKKSCNFQGPLGEISSEISSKNKPGDHGTGSAFGARAASKASGARARRSQPTLQAETAKTHQQEQEPPRAGQQEHRDSEPGHSLGAKRRRLGVLSWDRFVRYAANQPF